MKKIILLLVVVVLTLSVSGQEIIKDTTQKKERRARHSYKNIIAIDATKLLSQFFNFNASNYNYFSSPYMITYRRVFKRNAIRLGVGGNVASSERILNDSLTSKSARNDYSIGLGFEHYNYLSQRWSYYYGVELTMFNSITSYRYPYSSLNYQESSTNSKGYGVAPLLGIVFRISKRMSVATETSYNLSYIQTTSRSRSVPWNPYDNKSVSKGLQSIFNPPTSISFRFKF